MPRKTARQRRYSKKCKVAPNRTPTAMTRTRISENTLCNLNDFGISRTGILTFIYLNLNCNLQTGIMHDMHYEMIADYHGWTRATAISAIAELESVGLINLKSAGEIKGTIPQQAFMTEQQRLENKEKPERDFYQKFRQALDERGGEANLPANTIFKILTQLAKAEQSANRFYPKEDRIGKILDRLRYFENK